MICSKIVRRCQEMNIAVDSGIIQCVDEIINMGYISIYISHIYMRYKFCLNIIPGITFLSFSLEPLGLFHLNLLQNIFW